VVREDRARLLRWAAKTRRRHRLAGAVLRDAAPMLPRAPDPVAPVFVIGAPRSGTTLVFELFDRSPSLASLDWFAVRPTIARPSRSCSRS